MRQTEMIYHTPPAEWMEGLPIGNGRIAAMVWGESGYDRLTLNHEWLWKGQHRDRRCEDNAAHLPEVRACIERGRLAGSSRTGQPVFWRWRRRHRKAQRC